MDKADKELMDALDEIEKRERKTRIDNENLFGKPKKKIVIPKKKKRDYKLDVRRRTDVYKPIWENPYYQFLKKQGHDKDEILCGTNEDTIEVNEILFRCMMAAKLIQAERQVFEWVLFNTTGREIREVELNIYQIAKDLGITRQPVYRGIQGLCKKEMIFITNKKRYSDVRMIYINTMCDTWKFVGDMVGEIVGRFWMENDM